MRLVLGHDKQVAKWVAKRIPFSNAGFGDTPIGIGVVDQDGYEMAGVVFHDYHPEFATMAVSIAAATPRWATRRLIAKILTYPFEQSNVNKLWSAVSLSNERSLRFAYGIGFVKEATLANHFGKDHAVILRMLRKEYDRVYKGKTDGQKPAIRAAAA